ncbi:hypothetical protein [Halopseudomonas pelagia]|uniref:hypothetical protein n=1 Tax=Halopseudomonas pelagia TaxID=553151 RepID=UPI0003A8373A|nr:hypothetical protein [Halopseudomonas pelagia]
MELLEALENLEQTELNSVEEYQAFLDQFSPDLQAQMIAALSTGVLHLQDDYLREDAVIRVEELEIALHLSPDKYAEYLYKKRTQLNSYVARLLTCMQNSKLDINTFWLRSQPATL